MIERQPLGHLAVKRAAGRGFTTYGLAGCSQLRKAKARGWLREDSTYCGEPRFVLTPRGRSVARAQGWKIKTT